MSFDQQLSDEALAAIYNPIQCLAKVGDHLCKKPVTLKGGCFCNLPAHQMMERGMGRKETYLQLLKENTSMDDVKELEGLVSAANFALHKEVSVQAIAYYTKFRMLQAKFGDDHVTVLVKKATKERLERYINKFKTLNKLRDELLPLLSMSSAPAYSPASSRAPSQANSPSRGQSAKRTSSQAGMSVPPAKRTSPAQTPGSSMDVDRTAAPSNQPTVNNYYDSSVHQYQYMVTTPAPAAASSSGPSIELLNEEDRAQVDAEGGADDIRDDEERSVDEEATDEDRAFIAPEGQVLASPGLSDALALL